MDYEDIIGERKVATIFLTHRGKCLTFHATCPSAKCHTSNTQCRMPKFQNSLGPNSPRTKANIKPYNAQGHDIEHNDT